MTISIITATLNRRSLKDACESVNQQTYRDWHHYVIGDGLTPVDYMHPRRTSIGFSRPIGATEPTADMPLGTPNPILRWALQHLALGQFVCFLDDDNCYRPHFLEKMVAALELSDAGIALCMLEDLRFKDHESHPSLYRIDEDAEGPPFDGYPQLGHCDNSAFLAYSDLAKAVTFPLASPEDDAIQDYLFINALASLHHWVRVPEKLVLYGTGPNYPPVPNRCRTTN